MFSGPMCQICDVSFKIYLASVWEQIVWDLERTIFAKYMRLYQTPQK